MRLKIKLLVILVLVGIAALILHKGRSVKDPCVTDQSLSCWQKSVTDTFKKKGLSAAFDLVDYYYQRQPEFAANCHNFGHLLGTLTYDVFSKGEKFDISPKTAFCSYGFYHGFMEVLVAKQGDVLEAREFCRQVDRKLKAITPDASLQCFHGIGHGWVNAHDRPDTWGNAQAMVEPALSLCREVAGSEVELSRCATGVFNGISVFAQSNEYGLKADYVNPLGLCDLQTEPIFADACYLSFNITLLQVASGDLVKAASFLKTISDPVMAEHAMINLAALDTFNEGSIARCHKAEDRLQVACVQGYAFGFLEKGQPGVEYQKALAVCEREELTAAEKTGCYDYIFSYLPQWYPEEKAVAICQSYSGDLAQYCLQRVGLYE